MPRGGYRPGSGPLKGTKYAPREKKAESIKPTEKQEPEKKTAGDEGKAAEQTLSPLDYMLKVINDPAENAAVRRQMAIAAAPFCHSRKGNGVGKKEEKESKAKKVGAGRFAAGKPPAKILPFKKGTDEL